MSETRGPASFMQRAVAIALEKMRGNEGGPFGAVVVREGAIVAEGWNRVTSTNDPTAHAEVVAIRAACERLGTFDLSDCEMFASCEPCPMCLGAIYWARFRALYYANTRQEAAAIGFDDEFIYCEVPLDPAARSIPTQQLTTPDSGRPFAEWTVKPDKVEY
jgi:tRNA(Arg) A34 adenosine deaminase TadA